MLTDVCHVRVGGGRDLLCHWPRQGGIWHWGNEILAAYIESPCRYKDRSEVGHGQTGIWKQGYVRLRRSLDGGQTWGDAGKVFDNSVPVDEQRRLLHLDDYHGQGGTERDVIDMDSPDAILIMGRAWCGQETEAPDGSTVRENVSYCFRSADRGRSWENVPSIIWPNHTRTVVELANNYMKTGSPRMYAWLVGCSAIEGPGSKQYNVQLYASDDHATTWHHYSEICHDPERRVSASYPHVVPLRSGRWLCFLGCWFGTHTESRWTSLCHSDDEGLNWSVPRRIQSWSVSPFPLLLDDGRLVVVFMRRNPDPTGLYVIVSDNEGTNWSKPFCLRDDTLCVGPRGGVDGGYPVAVQLDDGRIFTAYYWQHDDPDIPWYGGRKFIAGTYFRL